MPMNDASSWHIALHSWRNPFPASQPLTWQSRTISALKISAQDLREPFAIPFDDFLTAIHERENGYAEGDGSFGILGRQGSWKLVGNVFEFGTGIQYVELMGRCPAQELNGLVSLLEQGQTDQCVIQLMEAGFFVSTQQFVQLFGQ